MIGIFIRGFADIGFFIITLPIRVLLVLVWFLLVTIWVLEGCGSIRDYWNTSKSQLYSSLEEEIRWIKTGKL